LLEGLTPVPIADKVSPAPIEVRLAGVLTALPGLALIVFTVILLVNGLSQPAQPGNNIYAEAAYYVVLAAAILFCGVALVLGKTWARSPAVVIALLLIGVGWYGAGPSGQPGFGVPVGVVGIVVLVLIFRRPSRAWALGQAEGESEEEASERGGAAGRAARRERDER
jgi:PGF-CTERM protein